MPKKEKKTNKKEEASTKAEEGVDPAAVPFEDLVNIINKQYGVKSEDKKTVVAPVILQASGARALDIERIETGVFAIDHVTGGGLPRQRIIGFHGRKSSGKTTSAKKCAAAAQSKCRLCLKRWRYDTPREWVEKQLPIWEEKGFPVPYALWPKDREHRPKYGFDHEYAMEEIPEKRDKKIMLMFSQRSAEYSFAPPEERDCKCAKPVPFRTVWLDAEVAFDADWAWLNGLNLDWVFVIRPENAEQGIDTADAMMRSKKVDLLVVDSLAHFAPEKEVGSSVGESQMALQARLINKALRKWTSALASTGMSEKVSLTMILINQIRTGMGGYGPPTQVLPGGLGQTFATTIDLEFRQKEYGKGEDGEAAKFAIIAVKATKNRTMAAMAENEYQMWVRDYGGSKAASIDDKDNVIKWAKRYGFVEDRGGDHKGKFRWSYPNRGWEDTSEDKITAKIYAEPREFIALRTKVMDRLLGRGLCARNVEYKPQVAG